MSLYTILGAGGVVANELAKLLINRNGEVRLVSRSGRSMPGASAHKADIARSDEAVQAMKGSSVVFLCVGLKYDRRIWEELWPAIMTNTIEGCKQAGARLVFLDNVYSYGRVRGAMTESTTYNPLSKKGEIRAEIATKLMAEVKAGNIQAMIARAADFYGPFADNVAIPDMLVFKRLSEGNNANLLATADTKHSYTFTLDIANAMLTLADSQEAYGQVWHLPTAPDPPTGKEFVEAAAGELGSSRGYSILSKWILRAGGMFDRTIYEIVEMFYQNEYDYIFDSSKFTGRFGIAPTSYAEGIRLTAEYYKSKSTGKERRK